MMPYAKGMSQTTHMTDAKAFIAWLDAQPQVNKNRKIGTQGYSMGGPMAFRTAAARPIASARLRRFMAAGSSPQPSQQSASASLRDEGVVPHCGRRERRQAAAEEKDVLKDTLDKPS